MRFLMIVAAIGQILSLISNAFVEKYVDGSTDLVALFNEVKSYGLVSGFVLLIVIVVLMFMLGKILKNDNDSNENKMINKNNVYLVDNNLCKCKKILIVDCIDNADGVIL